MQGLAQFFRTYDLSMMIAFIPAKVLIDNSIPLTSFIPFLDTKVGRPIFAEDCKVLHLPPHSACYVPNGMLTLPVAIEMCGKSKLPYKGTPYMSVPHLTVAGRKSLENDIWPAINKNIANFINRKRSDPVWSSLHQYYDAFVKA